jgi:hypothetical protein
MAHFALLDDNGVVVSVFVGRDEDDENELSARTGDTYKQTSYNTRGGVHYDPTLIDTPSADQSKAFRKNYAGVGYTYDEARDAFIPPKEWESWVLNEDTCVWEPPIPQPDDCPHCYWDEDSLSWISDPT